MVCGVPKCENCLKKKRKEKKQGLYGTTALYCLDPPFPLSADNLYAGRCEILVSNKTLSSYKNLIFAFCNYFVYLISTILS